jgi:excisionase family DNA binding protein
MAGGVSVNILRDPVLDTTMNDSITHDATGEHLTTRQFASRYQIHEETVRRMIREHRVQAVKMGRHWRVPATEFERITKEGGV